MVSSPKIMFFLINLFLIVYIKGNYANTDYFCRNLTPQPSILIDQLMGIWYGVEIINHDSERRYVGREISCPIIHISEDRSYNSLYKDYNHYNYNYGNRDNQYDPSGRRTTERTYNRNYHYTQTPNQPNNPYDIDPYRRNDDQYRRNNQQYDPYRRTPPYPNNPNTYNMDPYKKEEYAREQYNRETYDRERLLNRANQDPYARERPNLNINKYERYPPVGYGKKFYEEVKILRLLWDENGASTEYRARVNVSMPGFWISSGPDNGSSLEPQVGHFAGTIQVLKVVGNHLVLNFCHLQPDKRYYTIILSRSPNLNNYDISGVHRLLHRKGLDTNNIKKVCNASNVSNVLNQIFLIFTVAIFFCK